MSFQNFEPFQNQHQAGETPAAQTGAPAPTDNGLPGQADPSPAPFQGPPSGENSAAPSQQQGGEGKTTLWYVPQVQRLCWMQLPARD